MLCREAAQGCFAKLRMKKHSEGGGQKNQGDHNRCQIQKTAEVEEERKQKGEGGVGKRDWAEESGHSVKEIMF